MHILKFQFHNKQEHHSRQVSIDGKFADGRISLKSITQTCPVFKSL